MQLVELHMHIQQDFAFSPEVTYNHKMTQVRGWSKSDRCYFSVTQKCVSTPNLVGVDFMRVNLMGVDLISGS